MKPPKLTLDIDEDDVISIGLLRLAKEVPDHELFFHINSLNTFKFKRIGDILFHGHYYDFYYPRYEAYQSDSEVCIHIIANKPGHSTQKKAVSELFNSEDNNRLLLEDHPDVDYFIKSSEPIDDFSVILLPENLLFQVEDFHLSPENELYQLIQYYE